jgi:hypothetical protein
MNLVLQGQGMMKITNQSSIYALMEATEPILQCLGIKQIMIHEGISRSGNTKYQNLKTNLEDLVSSYYDFMRSE